MLGSLVMSGDVELPSVQAVLDRAREHVPTEALPYLVMNDPGHPNYVEAYARVLARAEALREEDERGVPLIGTFDITENLLLSHSCAAESAVNRWFSVLTGCIELLGAARYRYVSFSSTLAGLLTDTFALEAAKEPGAPVDLLPPMCRELREKCRNPHEGVLALVGELLTATLTDAEKEARCRELHERHEQFQTWYLENGDKNPLYAKRAEFVWGAVADRAELPAWLELVETRFPRSPELAAETRLRLLREGKSWVDSERDARH